VSGRQYRAPRRAELSQHFLRNRALAASLVTQSTISSQDLVIEIGPGRGTLTSELAARCAHLIAVEVDERLHESLRVRFARSANIELVNSDFLQFELPRSPYKVFANTPFGLTATIIRLLTEAVVPPKDAYLVVQREAAWRFAGEPYAPETLQSLLLKPWWHIEVARRLRRTDFDPPPSVDSVLIWFAHRTRPLVEVSRGAFYRQFIASSFGRRGNSIRQCLRPAFTVRQIRRLSRDLRFQPSDRPSALSFDQWLGLFRFAELSRTLGRPVN